MIRRFCFACAVCLATAGCNSIFPDQQVRVYVDGKQVGEFRSQGLVRHDNDNQWSFHDKTGKRIEIYVDVADAPEQAEKQ